jgi:hypothetical protein
VTTVYRILKYEGSERRLDAVLDCSLPNGTRVVDSGLTITAATVDPEDTATIEFCRDQLRRLTVSAKPNADTHSEWREMMPTNQGLTIHTLRQKDTEKPHGSLIYILPKGG